MIGCTKRGFYTQEDGNLTLSMPEQDWVIIDYARGAAGKSWRLGDEAISAESSDPKPWFRISTTRHSSHRI